MMMMNRREFKRRRRIIRRELNWKKITWLISNLIPAFLSSTVLKTLFRVTLYAPKHPNPVNLYSLMVLTLSEFAFVNLNDNVLPTNHRIFILSQNFRADFSCITIPINNSRCWYVQFMHNKILVAAINPKVCDKDDFL